MKLLEYRIGIGLKVEWAGFDSIDNQNGLRKQNDIVL